MPFAVFRRHQRKLMGIIAILAMFGFVVSDSLFGLLRSGGVNQRSDAVVAVLYGKPVHRSDLAELSAERSLANAFMANLMQKMMGFSRPSFFGETTSRALVDAYILQHEADALGMPRDPEVAREWLGRMTSQQMDARLFEALLAPFRNSQNPVTGEQMLGFLGDQIRLMQVRGLPGKPEVTPLDIYQAYRDRYEQVSVDAVRFPVDDYLSQVRSPSEAELETFYKLYKEILPDPDRDTPGFKTPRLVQVEYAVLDGEAIAREIRAKLTEKELRDYYESRKSEFALPPLETLPPDLFADDLQNKNTPPPTKPDDASPELVADPTPPYRTFEEVRSVLESDLSRELARKEIDRRFEGLRDAMIKYSDAYSEVVEDNKEAKTRGETAMKPLPPRPSLKAEAQKANLTLVVSPPLDRAAAEHYEPIASARVGFSPASERHKFVNEFFSTSANLFEPIELVNDYGQYFLAWKISDTPPRVPPLIEIRNQVVSKWKIEQARPLTLKAAQELAEKARRAGGHLTRDMAGSRELITTTPVSRVESNSMPLPGQYTPPKPRPTEIPQIPRAGETLRDALFSLEEGEVAVEPDQPRLMYYVMALNKRYPVSYTTLYAPSGPRMTLQVEVEEEARDQRYTAWMDELRGRAGLKADWAPPDEGEERPSRPRDEE
jgi:hypothetical protein